MTQTPTTDTQQAGTMQDARLVATEVLVPAPKRFVRESLVRPDGYECDWYYIDAPPSVMVVPSPKTASWSWSASTGTT